MKICFIYPGDLSIDNGGKTHTIEFARNWSTFGNEVFLFSRGLNQNKNGQTFRYIKVPIIPLKGLSGISFSVFSFILLLLYHFRFNFDIIFERKMLFCFSPLAGKILKIPTIIEINEYPLSVKINRMILEENRYSKRLLYKIIRSILKVDTWLTFELSSKIITTAKLKLDDVPVHKIYPIQFGANIEKFKPVNKNECRQILDYHEKDQIICFLGTFLPWQGIEYIIEAMPLILQEFPNAILMIIGDTEPKMDRSVELKERIVKITKNFKLNNNILFLGRIPYEKVPLYINACDLGIIAQRPMRVGFTPLKLFEYIACGKPVVATDIEGIREIIKESMCGLLVPPENSEKMADAIIELLKDDRRMEEMGANGLRSVKEKYNWESVAKKAIEICKMAVNGEN